MLGVAGVVFASLTAIRQVDVKRIIAYSSIAHISMAVIGVFANNLQGLQGAMYLILAHGFVSSALFLLVGVLYDRHHSRFVKNYGGLAQVMPIYACFFLLFTMANIGFPLTFNFLSEYLIFISVFREGF
jgi:NADH-quinone oxidoreductase subunit M